MRIGVIAPLDRRIPPVGHAGVERVIEALAGGLARRGHEVTLFCAGGSRSDATVIESWPSELKDASPAMINLATTRELIDAFSSGHEVDVWSNHLYHSAMAFGAFSAAPIATTIHGPWSLEKEAVYQAASKKSSFIAISNHQRSQFSDVNFLATIYNGIDPESFSLGTGNGNYLAWIGWISEKKGAADAIRIAKATNTRLKLAGMVARENEDFFNREIVPHLSETIEFVGEIDGADKVDFYGDAIALLSPLRWEEPFGLVPVEAMACGTPVLTTKRGAMPELIKHGSTGYLADSPDGLGDFIKLVPSLDRPAIRDYAIETFSNERMLDAYEQVYTALAAKS